MSAFGREERRERAPDRANALHEHTPAGEVRRAEAVLDARLDRVQHPDRRAATAVPPGPCRSETQGQRSATMSRSAGVMFMSPAVRYVPPRTATSSAYRSSSARRAAPSGSAGTPSTALPPPRSAFATAIFTVIACDSRNASARPSAGG